MKEAERPARMDRVAKLDVPLSVKLAERTFPLEQLLELRPGAVLELHRRHDAPLDLYLNGSHVGRGRAVDIGERLGFRVEEVEDPARGTPPGSIG